MSRYDISPVFEDNRPVSAVHSSSLFLVMPHYNLNIFTVSLMGGLFYSATKAQISYNNEFCFENLTKSIYLYKIYEILNRIHERQSYMNRLVIPHLCLSHQTRLSIHRNLNWAKGYPLQANWREIDSLEEIRS